jgi:tetratricopeptide (TPR) repeat protein
MTRLYFQILSILILLTSCGQRNQSASPIKSNDDSVFVLSKEIDNIENSLVLRETEYTMLYDLADRIKPYCDNFQGADKSKLPEIYNFCAEMLRRRCYIENGRPYSIKDCKYKDDLIDCCLKAIPICKQTTDTLSSNYTCSLHFLADAYEQTGKIEEAMKLRFQLLEINKKMYTEMSDPVAFTCYDIGKTYETGNDIKSANEYFKKVLSLQKVMNSKFLTEHIDSIKAFQKRYKTQLK